MQIKNLNKGLLVAVIAVGSLPFGTASADGVTAGVDARSRVEYTQQGNIPGNTDGDSYTADQRTRVSLDGAAGDVSASVSVQENRRWSGEGSALEVYEASVQFAAAGLAFQVGRQEFSMDEGRLMGTDDWNAGRSYDGVKVGYSTDSLNLELFATSDGEGELYVIHPSTSVGDIDVSIPVMYRTDAIGGGTASNLTAGIHAASDGDISWRVEAYFQQHTADEDTDATTAIMASLAASYKVSDTIAPRINIDYTAGVSDAAANHVFSAANGNTHQYNGHSDVITAGVGGLIDASVSNDFGAMGPGNLSAAVHYMMLADADAAGADDAAVGIEIDIEYTISLADQLSLTIGEAILLDQGDAAADDTNSTHDWTYIQLSLNI